MAFIRMKQEMNPQVESEDIMLPSPLEPCPRSKNIYGFGVSKMSGEYKVVRISCGAIDGRHDCQVYTVGTGSWRKIEFDDQFCFEEDAVGAFLNGNLHWLGFRKTTLLHRICCLDLETEHFSSFSPPWPLYRYSILSVLGDYLCNTFYGFRKSTGSWLMKEYGDEKSWTMKFQFARGLSGDCFFPIKVFNDGDMLIQWGSSDLLYYSKKHDLENVDLFKDDLACATIYAPNFLPLKTFAMENVSSF